MSKYMIIVIALTLTSCCDTYIESTYSYKDILIKRVDKCGKTIFYYYEIDNVASRIWVEYSGINDGFSGYLKFGENGKVYLFSGDGYFQSSNDDTLKFEYKRIMAHQRPSLEKNVYQIELSTRHEKVKNLNTVTDVKVIYDIDKRD